MGLCHARMGEKEKPWIRFGQGGSISGWLNSGPEAHGDYRDGYVEKDVCSGHIGSGC